MGNIEKITVNILDLCTTLANITQKINNTADNISNNISNVISFVSNEDPAKVGEDNGIAFYKGTPYVKTPLLGNSAFSFGMVFIGEAGAKDPNLVKHEYGHVRHMRKIGTTNYLYKVVIPSVVCYWVNINNDEYNYYSAPFEYIADVLGDVDSSSREYLPNTSFWGGIYFHFSFLG